MGTPPPPPLSPTVATPLAHRKRRHSEINGSERPKVTESTDNDEHKERTIPVKARLQVPSRGRSSTPVQRQRSETPSSSSAKKPQIKANGVVSPRPHASPRPKVVSNRPSASPHPRVAERPSASPRPKQHVERRLEDSDSDDDGSSAIDKSDIEDILDSAELEPFTLATEDDTPDTLDAETVASLKQRLLDVGPQEFMEETLNKAKMPPWILGIVFGLPPKLYEDYGNDVFMKILGQMVVRHFFKRQKLPQYNTLDDVAELLKKSSKIMVITGAGISTSLGIPDFRSSDGFYQQAKTKAEKLGFPLSEPEEIFNIENFDDEPKLFYTLAGDILPDESKFSPTHAFIKLLQDKGKLLTCYTQNIDNLEQSAGISKDKLIQCHGSFATATCRRKGVKNVGHRVPGSDIFPAIRAGVVAECQVCKRENDAMRAEMKAQEQRKKRFKLTPNKRTPTPFADDDDEDDISAGIMKPDITFFGEQLPNTFFERFTERDCKVVDLVLVLGTSLKVAPVSEMPNYLPHQVPHVYVSREAIRHVEFDVQCLGDCDDVAVELCRRAGWSGSDGKGVVGHELVEAKDREGRAIVVEAEGDGEEGWKWRVRREN